MRKDVKMKSIVLVLGILVLFGIIELVVFGVNLKLKYLFIGVLIGLVVGLVYVIFMKVLLFL